MGSYVMEEFVGNGSLKQLLPKLLEEGWDDVPTLKMMDSQDMDAINMTPQQKNALEIRSYLHDRALLQYGDKLEASGKTLEELQSTNATDLSSEFGLKRGHIARFTDKTISLRISLPPSYSLPRRQRSTARTRSIASMTATRTISRNKANIDESIEGSRRDLSIREFTPSGEYNNISPYSTIESISVQKLTPEYKIGLENSLMTNAATIKSSQLWRDKPAVVLCVRRPGCIMCRAEAHQLYARKPIFDALGIQLIAVLHEEIDSEVKDYWPHYWGGMVVVDRNKEFFKALGGGKVVRSKFLTGFVFNAKAIFNYKRAKSMGVEQSFKGEGEIKGGLFVVGKGKKGIVCQFVEKNFGDWAPIDDVINVCTQMQRDVTGREPYLHLVKKETWMDHPVTAASMVKVQQDKC
ncbi:hypothetical protein ACHQM5_008809 [Ranunculus cassubicifolius]